MARIAQTTIGYLIGWAISLLLARELAKTQWGWLAYSRLAEEIIARLEESRHAEDLRQAAREARVAAARARRPPPRPPA